MFCPVQSTGQCSTVAKDSKVCKLRSRALSKMVLAAAKTCGYQSSADITYFHQGIRACIADTLSWCKQEEGEGS